MDTRGLCPPGRRPRGALHRLPESVAHVAEALWMQALDEGRRCAAHEQNSTERALAMDKQHLEVRSHVLSLREGELQSRLRDREQRMASLYTQIQDLMTLLRKERATQEAQAKRTSALEEQLLARAQAPRKARRSKSPSPPTRKRPKRTALRELQKARVRNATKTVKHKSRKRR